MTVKKEQLALWQDVLGDDAPRYWQAMAAEVAPPLRSAPPPSRNVNTAWRWVGIAASAALLISVVGNAMFMQMLGEARQDYLVASLAHESPAMKLAALNQLPQRRLSAETVAGLESLIIESADPNLQLAALDLLLDTGNLTDGQALQALLLRVRNNAAFLSRAVRARSTQI